MQETLSSLEAWIGVFKNFFAFIVALFLGLILIAILALLRKKTDTKQQKGSS